MMRTLLIIIAVIVLLVGGFLVYQRFFVAPAEELTTTIGPRTDLPGSEIIAELNKLPTDLNAKVFAEPAYHKLVDGSVQLQTIPAGKTNPFAPIFSTRSTTAPRR